MSRQKLQIQLTMIKIVNPRFRKEVCQLRFSKIICRTCIILRIIPTISFRWRFLVRIFSKICQISTILLCNNSLKCKCPSKTNSILPNCMEWSHNHRWWCILNNKFNILPIRWCNIKWVCFILINSICIKRDPISIFNHWYDRFSMLSLSINNKRKLSLWRLGPRS